MSDDLVVRPKTRAMALVARPPRLMMYDWTYLATHHENMPSSYEKHIYNHKCMDHKLNINEGKKIEGRT